MEFIMWIEVHMILKENGQAKATKREWANTISLALWAYRATTHTSTKAILMFNLSYWGISPHWGDGASARLASANKLLEPCDWVYNVEAQSAEDRYMFYQKQISEA